MLESFMGEEDFRQGKANHIKNKLRRHTKIQFLITICCIFFINLQEFQIFLKNLRMTMRSLRTCGTLYKMHGARVKENTLVTLWTLGPDKWASQ
jgi:hypothetical protein